VTGPITYQKSLVLRASVLKRKRERKTKIHKGVEPYLSKERAV
jgi:hypothetical protein